MLITTQIWDPQDFRKKLAYIIGMWIMLHFIATKFSQIITSYLIVSGYLIASPTTFGVKYLIIFFITNFIGQIIFAITETFSISLHSWIWPPGNTWPVIMFPSPARFVGRPLGPNAAPTHDKIFASLCLYLCKLPRIVYLDWNDWTLIFAEITFCFRSKMKNVWK